MKALILRLDAPLISFGSVVVDQHGFSDHFPGLSMLTGLVGNALGWQHKDFERLQNLQNRLDFAARWDVRPQRIIDYHTVDLSSPKMREPGWTTRGTPEHRGGGAAAKYGTHQRYRHYLVDGLMTVALGLTDAGSPTIDDIKNAIERPARPLFLGRKTCLPARPLLDPNVPIMEGADLLSILERVPIWNREGLPEATPRRTWACWTPQVGDEVLDNCGLVSDLRDWQNQLPAGTRWRAEGMIGREG
ncbi:MAG: type I-E CRISPR-associated protein Cas5/CasD [Firmicutes bacterium]|nr:type I-E CRISPR-associated protein Cas5/CasD [Bacillota bacterium]